jgi:hypothetical protein
MMVPAQRSLSGAGERSCVLRPLDAGWWVWYRPGPRLGSRRRRSDKGCRPGAAGRGSDVGMCWFVGDVVMDASLGDTAGPADR